MTSITSVVSTTWNGLSNLPGALFSSERLAKSYSSIESVLSFFKRVPSKETSPQSQCFDAALLSNPSPKTEAETQLELPVESVGFSSEFIQKIKTLNALKDKDAPLALVLQAKSDHNGIFSSPLTEFNLISLSKTHRVAIKIIQKSSEIQKTTDQIAQQFKRPNLLVIQGHGDSDKILFREGPEGAFRHPENKDFENLDASASIILYSCKTGQSLAKKIASIQPRPVYALVDVLDVNLTYYCIQGEQVELIGYDKKHRLISRKWMGEQEHLPSYKNDAIFQKQAEDLLKQAEDGNLEAAYYLGLGHFYGKGYGTWISLQQAIHHLTIAAEKKHAGASFELGCYYSRQLMRKNLDRAEHYLKRAADQGHAQAAYELALLYSLKIRTKDSLEKAVFYFEIAGQKGFAKAYFYLADCYKQGNGVHRSASKSAQCFKQAADLGDSQSAYLYAQCLEKGRGVPKSTDQALEYYRKAGEHPEAQKAHQKLSDRLAPTNAHTESVFSRIFQSIANLIILFLVSWVILRAKSMNDER